MSDRTGANDIVVLDWQAQGNLTLELKDPDPASLLDYVRKLTLLHLQLVTHIFVSLLQMP